MSPTKFQQEICRTVAQHLFDVSLHEDFYNPEHKYFVLNNMFLVAKLDDDATSKRYQDVLSQIENKVADIHDLLAGLKKKPVSG